MVSGFLEVFQVEAPVFVVDDDLAKRVRRERAICKIIMHSHLVVLAISSTCSDCSDECHGNSRCLNARLPEIKRWTSC